jgi:catechol 2,3-dioxygenase-like lactoylglutathione lyase family enzyme
MDHVNLRVKEVMAFVPSGKDYELSLRFYQEMGFVIDWKSEGLALVRIGAFRFFLQNFENRNMQDNFMMNVEVEDLDAWWDRLSAANLPEKYPGVQVKPPQVFPWGKREINVRDPAGICWHIAVTV